MHIYTYVYIFFFPEILCHRFPLNFHPFNVRSMSSFSAKSTLQEAHFGFRFIKSQSSEVKTQNRVACRWGAEVRYRKHLLA